MLLIIIKFKVREEKHEFFILTNTRRYSEIFAGSFLSHIFSEFLFIMILILLFTQVFSFHIKRNKTAEQSPYVVLRQWNDNLIQKSCLLYPTDLQVTKCIQFERYIFKSLSLTTLSYGNFQGPTGKFNQFTSSLPSVTKERSNYKSPFVSDLLFPNTAMCKYSQRNTVCGP